MKRCVHNINTPDSLAHQINSYIMYELSAQQVKWTAFHCLMMSEF